MSHLVSECNWPDGHPCPDCVARTVFSDEQTKLAQEAAAQKTRERTAKLDSHGDFKRAWRSAPPNFTRYCERQDAEYFYLLGIRDGYVSGVIRGNDVMSKTLELTLGEILKMMRGRGLV